MSKVHINTLLWTTVATVLFSSTLQLQLLLFEACISLVELGTIVAADLQAVALVSNEVARKIDTFICVPT